MTTVHIEDECQEQRSQQKNQQKSQRPRQPFFPKSQRPTGCRRPKSALSTFGMQTPRVSTETLQNERKHRLVQDEIQGSAAGLVKSTLGHLSADEDHAKRFKAEVDKSTAIPTLMADQLGWVSGLPPIAQLGVAIGEKWLRTRFA